MANLDDLYPAGPVGLPADIARPTLGYRLQVVGVLASLFLFVALYLCLIGASAYWVYWSYGRLTHPRRDFGRGGRSSDPTVFHIASVVAGSLLCLFFVKGLFKRTQLNQTFDVEIFEREQPLLFAFLRRLCAETNAPFPHRVFVNFQVNAAVFYQSLGWFLWSKPLPATLPGAAQSIDGVWIGEMFAAFGEIIDKCRRIHLKSMGGLLTCQEDIAQRWRGIKPGDA